MTLSIIAILALLVFAGSRFALRQAQTARCTSNLRQLFFAAEDYTRDNNNVALPGSRSGNSQFWMWRLRPYLGKTGPGQVKRIDDKFRCPAMRPGDQNYWGWGYGINSRPGLRGPASTAHDRRFNWESYTDGKVFPALTITYKSKRLFLADADQWHILLTNDGVLHFPDYDRHGKELCNVLFYDGHVETLRPDSIYKAVYDPGDE